MTQRFTFGRVLVAGGISLLFALAIISKVFAGRLSVLAALAVIVIYASLCLWTALLPSRRQVLRASDGAATIIPSKNWRLVVTLLVAWAAWQVYVLFRLRFGQ